ncbi:MAG: addiction module protein [Pirellulales bacterium]|nr:addiction module protein [Pirellulales bacterium]
MPPVYDEILTAARGLSASDRLRMLETLWEELSPEDWVLPSPAWIAAAQQRSANYDAGRSSSKPWGEVQENARKLVELHE